MSQSPGVVIRHVVSQSFEANRGDTDGSDGQRKPGSRGLRTLMAVGRVGQIETKTLLFSFPDRSQVCNTVLALLDTGSEICNKRRVWLSLL